MVRYCYTVAAVFFVFLIEIYSVFIWWFKEIFIWKIHRYVWNSESFQFFVSNRFGCAMITIKFDHFNRKTFICYAWKNFRFYIVPACDRSLEIGWNWLECMLHKLSVSIVVRSANHFYMHFTIQFTFRIENFTQFMWRRQINMCRTLNPYNSFWYGEYIESEKEHQNTHWFNTTYWHETQKYAPRKPHFVGKNWKKKKGKNNIETYVIHTHSHQTIDKWLYNDRVDGRSTTKPKNQKEKHFFYKEKNGKKEELWHWF